MTEIIRDNTVQRTMDNMAGVTIREADVFADIQAVMRADDPSEHMMEWCFAWTGGLVLARYIMANPSIVSGKTVLDFGTGCGIVGIACAKMGALQTNVNDKNSRAIDAAKQNALDNSVTLRYSTADLMASPPPAALDVIFVSDVWYEFDLRNEILTWLKDFVGDVYISTVWRVSTRGDRLFIPEGLKPGQTTLTEIWSGEIPASEKSEGQTEVLAGIYKMVT